MLSEVEVEALGFLYGPEPKPVSKIAIALSTTKEHAREIVGRLMEKDLVKRLERPDKPYFVVTQLGKDAAI